MLREPRTIERGLFREDAIKRIFAEHRAKHRDNGNRIWRLLNLETWFRVMIDGEHAALPDEYRSPNQAVALT
jgi:hypothetical protein